jgi:hypothetical protein
MQPVREMILALTGSPVAARQSARLGPPPPFLQGMPPSCQVLARHGVLHSGSVTLVSPAELAPAVLTLGAGPTVLTLAMLAAPAVLVPAVLAPGGPAVLAPACSPPALLFPAALTPAALAPTVLTPSRVRNRRALPRPSLPPAVLTVTPAVLTPCRACPVLTVTPASLTPAVLASAVIAPGHARPRVLAQGAQLSLRPGPIRTLRRSTALSSPRSHPSGVSCAFSSEHTGWPTSLVLSAHKSPCRGPRRSGMYKLAHHHKDCPRAKRPTRLPLHPFPASPPCPAPHRRRLSPPLLRRDQLPLLR